MVLGRLLFFGAFLILTSCCEEGERYPPLKEEGVDIVGNWELLGAKGEVTLSADHSGKFLIMSKQIEIRGTYRASGTSFEQHGYSETSREEKCLSYIFEWEDDEDESDPFSIRRTSCLGRLRAEGVLWLDWGAKIPSSVFIRER